MAIRFSVLLPTRNRLDLLKFAIESVLRQDYENWEIIVSDNDSTENIKDYIASLNDPRVRYFRTASFLPVTENWNNALRQAVGDYVIMLGDDDCLMPRYFSSLAPKIEKAGEPDFVYTSAYLFAYPGVMPGVPEGFLLSYSSKPIFQHSNREHLLEIAEARELARRSLDFRMGFDYNMQFPLVKRSFIQELAPQGEFYQSPYPDYYASNVLMLKARKILVDPRPLVTIGISPKSFGFFYFNNAEAQGNEFLKNLADKDIAERIAPHVLPGTNMNTSWLASMETIQKNYGTTESLQVNYSRYRMLQICSVLATAFAGAEGYKDGLRMLKPQLKKKEMITLYLPLLAIAFLVRNFSGRFRPRFASKLMTLTGSHPRFAPPMLKGEYKSILNVYKDAENKGRALVEP
ncbi:MAG: glycosyltransferase family 2 protein [Bdellovibrio sp.]